MERFACAGVTRRPKDGARPVAFARSRSISLSPSPDKSEKKVVGIASNPYRVHQTEYIRRQYCISKRSLKESEGQSNDSRIENIDDPMPSTSSECAEIDNTTDDGGEHNTIRTAFERVSSHAEGGSKFENITMCILFFICKDMRPFNVIEGEGFLKLMREVAPSYKVPSSKFMKKKLCEKYDVTKLFYEKKIEQAKEVCLTLDIWTETMAEKSFLGVTIHFLEGTKMINCNIATKELNENHTCNYLSNEINSVLHKWNISLSKIRCVITDNGANVVAAVKSVVSEKKHLPCFPHTINLIVDAALKHKPIHTIILKVRAIVIWIKNSVINSDKLRKIQLNGGVPEGSIKKLIMDVATRWNSVYYMLKRFLEMSRICSEILHGDYSGPQMPDGLELEIIKQLITLLQPLEFVSKESCGEQYITLSIIIPMINCLKTNIANFTTTIDCMKNVKQILEAEINRRFGKIEYCTHAAIATILDPRFKNIHFQDLQACGRAVYKLNEIIKEIMPNSNAICESEVASIKNYDFWQHHTRLAMDQHRKTQNKSDQLSLYLSTPVAPLNSCPLEQWEKLQGTYPLLYKQARGFLVVVASSVPCERLFSKAGATITKNRNRLSGKYLEKLLFLGSVPKDSFFQ